MAILVSPNINVSRFACRVESCDYLSTCSYETYTQREAAFAPVRNGNRTKESSPDKLAYGCGKLMQRLAYRQTFGISEASDPFRRSRGMF